MTERGCKIQAYAPCAYTTLEQLGKNLYQATHTMTRDFSLHGLFPRTVGHWTAPLCHLCDKPGRPNNNQSTNLSINQSINRSPIDWSLTAVVYTVSFQGPPHCVTCMTRQVAPTTINQPNYPSIIQLINQWICHLQQFAFGWPRSQYVGYGY